MSGALLIVVLVKGYAIEKWYHFLHARFVKIAKLLWVDKQTTSFPTHCYRLQAKKNGGYLHIVIMNVPINKPYEKYKMLWHWPHLNTGVENSQVPTPLEIEKCNNVKQTEQQTLSTHIYR